MKKTLLTVLLMAVSFAMAFAQDGPFVEATQVSPPRAVRTISGTLLDKESKEPVLQATIQLLKATDSTYVAGAVSDENGAFSLNAPENGKYIIKLSNVGYKTITRNITIADNKDFAFGKINMETDAVLLKEVVANGIAAKVVVKEDTFIYNASAYRTPEGSVIEELVKRLPGAQVDDSGNITINGKQVKKVKVDGKEFMTGDTQTALKNLPTAIIEKVKAYDEKSDMAKMTGVDDGEENTVLDFGIKKGMNKGFLSNIDLAIGTKSRYAERVMAGYMKDDSRVMLFGNANNTNDRGFGGRGGFGGGANGLQANKMLGINYNYEKNDKFRADFSVRWNHSDGDNNTTTSTENFVNRSGAFSNSKSKSYSRSNQWNMQANIEWKPDTMWTIQVRPSFSTSKSDSRSSNQSATFNEDPNGDGTVSSLDYDYLNALDQSDSTLLVNSNQSRSLSYSTSTSYNLNATVNRKLSSRGNSLTFQGRISKGTSDSKSISLQDMQYYQLKSTQYDPVTGTYADSSYYRNRYNLTPSDNWNFQTALSYSERLSKLSFLVLKYTYKYSNRTTTRSTYDFGNIENPYQFDMPEFRSFDKYIAAYPNELETYYVDTLSRHTEYDNYTHEVELTWRRTTPKYNLNLGMMIQPQSQQLVYKGQSVDKNYSNLKYLDDGTVIAKRSVFNFSPTLDFRYKWNKRKSIRLNYRSSTDQPSMENMLPITDDSNPMNITKGNPDLEPSFTQNFSLRYNNYVEKRFASVMSFVNFSNTQNSVSNMVTYNDLTGGRTTQPQNINGNWNINGALMYNTAIDTAGVWNVSSFTNVRYVNSVNYVTLAKTDAYGNTIYNLQDGSNRVTAIDDQGYIVDAANNQLEKYTGARNAVYDDATKNYTRSTTLSERLGISYRNSWLEVELNGNVDYSINRNELQPNSNLDTWNFTYGTDITVTAPWGTGFSTSAHMSSRRGYNSAEANTDEFQWNIQVSQSFLKGKPLTLSVQFYDILHQKSSFSRSIDANSRRDTWSNAINSYCMFHAIYRFNAFGGKNARQGMRRGNREGGPDGDRGPGGDMQGPPPGGGGGGPRGGMGGGPGGPM